VLRDTIEAMRFDKEKSDEEEEEEA
jgi:hypothetical protein